MLSELQTDSPWALMSEKERVREKGLLWELRLGKLPVRQFVSE
jgi:hypothetical protein